MDSKYVHQNLIFDCDSGYGSQEDCVGNNNVGIHLLTHLSSKQVLLDASYMFQKHTVQDIQRIPPNLKRWKIDY